VSVDISAILSPALFEIPVVVPLLPAFAVTVQPADPGFAIALLPTGPKGDPGSGTAQTATGTASLTLSGHRAVVLQPDGTFIYDDSTLLGLRFAPPALTLGAASVGATVSAIIFGYVSEPSWAWTPEEPVFLGPQGILTQVAPSLAAGDAFQLQVAVAVSPTTILWAPQAPIVLA
jgi:hypothetical protein